MKSFIFLLPALLFFSCLSAQENKWTWVHGDSIIGVSGVYGTKGVPSSETRPGKRINSLTWTDMSGNLWLFGGLGYAELNDLWKYDITTNQWTWVSGTPGLGVVGVYGTQGIPGTANMPGSREGAVGWADNDGNLWLFGGYGYSAFTNSLHLSDLWKYNIATNQWTWIKGDSTGTYYTNPIPGVYGTRGVPSPANQPGARWQGLAWKDSSGAFWLFGGFGYSGKGEGSLNDLWKYDVSTNQWTWMHGDDGGNSVGVRGMLGVADPSNKPRCRQLATGWLEGNDLWLFGGLANTGGGGSDALNDLWKYDIATNQWTWMKGSEPGDDGQGRYGIRGVAADANKPAITFAATGWANGTGNLWLFGGRDFSTGLHYQGALWKYNIATNRWTWVKGDSTRDGVPVYGIRGVAAAANRPGARSEMVSWTDLSGNLWLFGGLSMVLPVWPWSGYVNDLWKYTPPSGPNEPPTISITSPAPNAVINTSNTILLNTNAADEDGNIVKVEFFNNGIKFSEDLSEPFQYTGKEVAPGNYVLTAKAFDNNGDSSISDTVRVTVTACESGTGSILGIGYFNIWGDYVINLTSNPRFPDSPTIIANLPRFEYGMPNFNRGTLGLGNNYGGWVRGYICAPLTGNYTFYIASDNQSELWLSTDENPANKKKIAYLNTAVNPRIWTLYYTQKSAPIRLVQGGRYYIETLHKQGYGPDHLSVAWVWPDGTTEGPIPGIRLSPWNDSIVTHSTVRSAEFVLRGTREPEAINGLSVRAAANPSPGNFILITKSNSEKQLSLVVTDITGRVMEKRTGMAANGTIRLGEKFTTGIYFVEVMQGAEKIRLKLIRQ